MSRLINQPIQVTAVPGRDGLTPAWFIWRGSRYRVEAILDCWQDATLDLIDDGILNGTRPVLDDDTA